MSNLEIVIHKGESGGYWAEIPSMPGCFTDGSTLAEVRRNIVEAAQCWLGMELKLALRRTANRRRTVRGRPRYEVHNGNDRKFHFARKAVAKTYA